jgi:hypothetical protein
MARWIVTRRDGHLWPYTVNASCPRAAIRAAGLEDVLLWYKYKCAGRGGGASIVYLWDNSGYHKMEDPPDYIIKKIT